jgi:hypothetical protein
MKWSGTMGRISNPTARLIAALTPPPPHTLMVLAGRGMADVAALPASLVALLSLRAVAPFTVAGRIASPPAGRAEVCAVPPVGDVPAEERALGGAGAAAPAPATPLRGSLGAGLAGGDAMRAPAWDSDTHEEQEPRSFTSCAGAGGGVRGVEGGGCSDCVKRATERATGRSA